MFIYQLEVKTCFMHRKIMWKNILRRLAVIVAESLHGPTRFFNSRRRVLRIRQSETDDGSLNKLIEYQI